LQDRGGKQTLELVPPDAPELLEVLSDEVSLPPAEGNRLCMADPKDGYWLAYYPSSPAINRVVYEQVCSDVIYCDQYGNCTQPDGRDLVRLLGSCCGGTCECNWGVERVNYYNSTWSYAVYNFSFKQSVVWFRYYTGADVLLVVTQNTYNDGRPYLETWDYFTKYANYGDVGVY
jgi:hypothetical protein